MSEKSPSPSASNSGRFPKGRSGNPGGRPIAPRDAEGSAFDIVLKKRFTVADGAHAGDHRRGNAPASDPSGRPGGQSIGHARSREVDREARGMARKECAKGVRATDFDNLLTRSA
jgi:hypothetical protein